MQDLKDLELLRLTTFGEHDAGLIYVTLCIHDPTLIRRDGEASSPGLWRSLGGAHVSNFVVCQIQTQNLGAPGL